MDSNVFFSVDQIDFTRAEIVEYLTNICSDFIGCHLADANSHQFAGILAMAGDHFFSKLPISRNIQALQALSELYLNLCLMYAKLPSMLDFCRFTSTDPSHWEDERRLNPTEKQIHKNITRNRENTLKMKCYDSNSIIGSITLGNTEFYWNNYGLKPMNDNRTLSLDTLDDLSVLIPEKKNYDIIDSIVDKEIDK